MSHAYVGAEMLVFRCECGDAIFNVVSEQTVNAMRSHGAQPISEAPDWVIYSTVFMFLNEDIPEVEFGLALDESVPDA